jgi:hypothetical protein
MQDAVTAKMETNGHWVMSKIYFKNIKIIATSHIISM